MNEIDAKGAIIIIVRRQSCGFSRLLAYNGGLDSINRIKIRNRI